MARRDEDADASGEGTSWLVLRHSQAEGLGLLGNALRERGIHHRALELARGEPVPKELRGVGGLIVLGGPMGAYEHGQVSVPALGDRTAREGDRRRTTRPGHLPRRAADRAGARRARLSGREARGRLGARHPHRRRPRRSALRRAGTRALTVFHLHGDTYELPPDGVNLATSPVYEQQAFRWGEIVYGFQFHLEFTESIIARLAQEPDSQRYMTDAGADVKRIVAETPGHVRTLTDTAQRVFENYFSGCGL